MNNYSEGMQSLGEDGLRILLGILTLIFCIVYFKACLPESCKESCEERNSTVEGYEVCYELCVSID